ncbi:MAG: extracellular solute-binding protein [Oscillospiraceae bacterium]|nr:extracellular solute-binding protein [Oscillospiraceae bacterium]
MALLLVLSGILYLSCRGHGNVTLRIGVYAGSYWGTPNGGCYQILDNAVRRFEDSHPGVTVEYVSGIPADAYSEWLAGQILKGQEPDLYFVLPEDFSLLVSSGALKKLDKLIADDPDFDPQIYYEPSLHSGVFSGSQYALPYESVPTMMFVNKTLLEENGIVMPDSSWTWTDFYRICQQVTDVENHRFGVYGYTWLNALYSNGATLFSEDGRTCYLADEKIEESIQFVKSLNRLNGGYTVTARDFDLGNVAFRPFLFSEYLAYQPYPWRVKKYSGFEWDCICMPAGKNGRNVSELHTVLLGLSARTANQELAWEFVKLLSTDVTVQKELYLYSHGISPVRSIAESGDVQDWLDSGIPSGTSFSQKELGKIMSTAVIAPRFDTYSQAVIMAESAAANELNSEILQKSRLLNAQREINIYLSQH